MRLRAVVAPLFAPDEYDERAGRQRSMFLVSEIVEKRNTRDVEAGYRGPDFSTNYS